MITWTYDEETGGQLGTLEKLPGVTVYCVVPDEMKAGRWRLYGALIPDEEQFREYGSEEEAKAWAAGYLAKIVRFFVEEFGEKLEKKGADSE